MPLISNQKHGASVMRGSGAACTVATRIPPWSGIRSLPAKWLSFAELVSCGYKDDADEQHPTNGCRKFRLQKRYK
jgi:hypothetical protein